MVRGSSPSGSSSRKRSPSPQGGSKTSPSLKKRTSPGGGAPSKTSASAPHPLGGQLAEAPTTKGHGSPGPRAPAYLDTLKFIVGVTGIFVMYGIFYSDSQKALTSKQGDGTKFTQTAFVMLFQCAGNALFSLLAHGVTAGVFKTCTVEEEAAKPGKDGKLRPVVPFLTVLASQDAALVSLAYVFAMYTSNRALEYVSFPFQILAKSCKMIPVMLGSILLLRKRYSLLKVASVLIMTAGVVAFSAWEKKKGAADDSAWGIVLLVVSLVLDGAGGPLQEGMKKYPLTAFLQNLVSNVWAIVYMGLVVAVNNEFFPAIKYLQDHPSLQVQLVKFTIASAIGQAFIFFVIREFGALVNTQVTTVRKLFSIVWVAVLGPYLFPLWNRLFAGPGATAVHKGEEISMYQWAAVIIVFVGVVIGEQGGKH